MNTCEERSCCNDNNKIRNVSTELEFKDRLGALKVRFGFGRMNYRIDPGLYAVGKPNDTSPVLVSANYKLTFDSLRKELSGLDCYLLILDTKGVNVWCSAGKGTFSADEIAERIEITGLENIVSHRTLILPQLAAPGVSAQDVKKLTGFTVTYGPIRAQDLKEFLKANMNATKEMREVKFTLRDRLVLTPVEFMAAMKISMLVFGVLFLVNLFAAEPFGVDDLIVYMGAVVMGTIITPILLPFIPVRAFSLKGWITGFVCTLFIVWAFGWFYDDVIVAIGYLLVLPSFSAFLAMNFTGSSTYTSFSGVMKEMKIAVPFIVLTTIIGIIFLFAGKIV